jgi:folylpolyglutamate synthase/dihydropteroate synthase
VHEWGRLLVIGGAESHDEHDDAILGRFVLLDYAHNPAAIAAVTGVLHRVWGRSRQSPR